MSDMSSCPLVSVIIPTYNRAGLLKLAIDSVLAQTYPHIELIVVDDGSTDDTPRMLEAYGDRIVVVRKANRGGTAARNSGIEVARGEYFNFMDHDDLMAPAKIEKQVAIMHARPEVGLVHCGFYRIDRDGNPIDKVNFLPEGDVRPALVQGCFLWSGAPLIRREVIERVGTFDVNVWSSDADLWLRIAIAGYHFGCVQEPLGSYRILPDSAMADISGTERMDMSILERVFADPRLPDEARRMKPFAYFNQRFWLSCRYYTVGKWEDAQRNMLEAILWKPSVMEHPSELLHLICINVLDPRVADPVQYMNDVFDHLPSEVEAAIGMHRDYLLSWVYAGLSMRNYARGNVAEARRQFEQAIALDHTIIERKDDFARALCDYALRLPVAPRAYIDTVLDNLPHEARALAQLRRQVISEVTIASAFRDYQTGRRRLVPKKVFDAVRYRPQLLSNRGVLAIFVKSLPQLMARTPMVAVDV